MNGASNGNFFFGPAPGEGSKCQISFNFNNKVRKRGKIRNRFNQAPHLTQDTNGKVTTSQFDSQFDRFLYKTLCVFSQKNDTKHIRQDFSIA